MCHQLTCPVAMKIAVTIFAACALNPPRDPAMAEPTRFLLTLSSRRASTLVFSTLVTTWPGTMASHTTDLPRPSTQLMADGFLSVQKLPLREMISSNGNFPLMKSSAFSTPYNNRFAHERGSSESERPTDLREHIHAHCVSRAGLEAYVEESAGHGCLYSL